MSSQSPQHLCETPQSHKLMKLLDSQRRTDHQFCDITLELDSGYKVFGHFCIIGPQSEFIANNLDAPLASFSIRNPLQIKIENFNCNHCLNTIVDFFYSERIEILADHEEHFKRLVKILAVANLNTIFNNPETLDEFFDDRSDEYVTETLITNAEKVNFYRIPTTATTAANKNHNQDNINSSKLNNCPGCSFKCFKISEMVSHLSHCTSDNMICSLCDIGFYSADDFYVHLVNHENAKAFYCFDCDQRFSTKTALFLHTPKHSLDAPYQCQSCPKRFRWKQALTSHSQTHLKEKKLLCDVCGYSTINMKALRSHKLMHIEDGRCKQRCTYTGCDYISSRRENLKIHMDTHKNVKPFICEICGKKFSQGKNYKRHALLHSEKAKENYKCLICNFGTSRSDKLKEHVNKNHK